MHRPYRLLPLLAMLAVLPLSGCFFSREIADTRRQIEAAYPEVELEKQIVLNLGPFALRTIEWMSRFAPEDVAAYADRYLDDVRRVKVGVFRRSDHGRLDKFSISKFGFTKGWKVAVKVRQEEQNVWILYRDDVESIEDLYVVALGEEDLVIARVKGRLDRLVANALEDHSRRGLGSGTALQRETGTR